MYRSKFILSACAISLLAGSLTWIVSSNVSPSAAFNDEDISIKNFVKSLPKSDIACDIYNITLATGNDIDDHIVSSYKGSSSEKSNRSYKDYDDEFALSKMSDPEIKYYRRLEEAGYNYITNTSYDAYYVSAYDLYATDGVQYSDLGISKTKAVDITEYFIYNNPQYYFYKPSLLTSSQSIYITCYPDFASGDARAKTTDSLFSAFDEMRTQIIASGSSDFNKAVAAHDLICKRISYESGIYDQSVYSALMQNKTVCAGYSEIMAMLLNSCDIPTTVVASDTHAWNVVKLSGKYYGFDVTWDDSLGNYKYLAVSDLNLKKYDNGNEHTSVSPWLEYAPKCSDSNYTASAAADNGIQLSAPVVRTISTAENSITLQWDAVKGASKYQYDLAYDKNFKNTFNSNKETTGCSVRIINMQPNTVYYTRVRAVGNSGNVYSDYTVTPVSYNKTVTLSAPVLKYTRTGDQSISVSWNKISGATQYQYDVSSKSTFDTFVLKNKKTTSNSISLTDIQINRDYYVRVKAVSDVGQSDYAVIKVRITEQVPAKPSVSAKLADGGFTITFDTQDKNVDFYYEIALGDQFNNSLAKSKTSSKSVKYTNAASGKTYYIRAKAHKTVGSFEAYSDYSDVCKITMPVNNTATASNKLAKPVVSIKQSSVILTVKWNKVSGAQKYEYVIATDSSYKNVIASKSIFGTMAMISVSKYTGSKLYIKVRSVSGNNVSDWVYVSIMA